MSKYKYDSITANIKTGNKYTSEYCDYYIQDGILTVFREETFEMSGTRYYKFEEHFPMENIERILCVER